jgi:hypothetical protein
LVFGDEPPCQDRDLLGTDHPEPDQIAVVVVKVKKVMGVGRPGSGPRQIAYDGLVDEVAPDIRSVHRQMDNAKDLDDSSVIGSAREADFRGAGGGVGLDDNRV